MGQINPSHPLERLAAEALEPGAVPSLSAAEREHIAGCARCRESIAGLVSTAVGSDEARLLVLARLEELGCLPDPPQIPRFDLSFLEERLALWVTVSAGAAASIRLIRELAREARVRVQVAGRHGGVSFADIVAPFQPAPALVPAAALGPVRRGPGQGGVGEGAPETLALSLPDPDEGVELLLVVEPAPKGKSHLRVDVRALSPTEPIGPIQVRLLGPGGGLEVRDARDGEAPFLDLDPGEYTIEIHPTRGARAARGWRVPLSIESTAGE